MTKLNSKKLIPVAFVIMGIVFLSVSVFQLGFWVGGPGPGFFPTIISAVMILSGIATFAVSYKEEITVKYHKDELLVILAGLGIFAGTFLIGFVPAVLVYLFLWMRVFEKLTWKVTLIIMAISMFITLGVFGLWLGIQFPTGLLGSLL